MDVPLYLRVLWSYKWLLLVGVIVAAFVGGIVGYSYVDGQLQPRAVQTYRASTTVLVGSPQQPLYQSVIPGAPVQEGVTPTVTRDLVSTTVVYAYIVSGSEIRTQVEAVVGPLADDEQVTAVRRTTQPAGDESFPGRLTLPILDIVGSAHSPARAEEISRAANTVFQNYVKAEQDATALPEAERVQLQTLRESEATEVEGSNPLIPVILTAFGVLLLVIALIFVLYNIRVSREKRRAATGRSKNKKGTGTPVDETTEPDASSSDPGDPASTDTTGAPDEGSIAEPSRDEPKRSDDTPAYV
jgi:capsular polysaccharide biosynthesis protein